MGLSAVVSGTPSPITVTTIELCQIKFVERDSFLRLIEHNSHAALACATMLAREVTTSFDDVYDLLLGPQFDAKACSSAALLGLRNTTQPGATRFHGIYSRRNCPDDWIFARNGNPLIE